MIAFSYAFSDARTRRLPAADPALNGSRTVHGRPASGESLVPGRRLWWCAADSKQMNLPLSRNVAVEPRFTTEVSRTERWTATSRLRPAGFDAVDYARRAEGSAKAAGRRLTRYVGRTRPEVAFHLDPIACFRLRAAHWRATWCRVTLFLTCAAAALGGTEPARVFRAGAATSNITPDLGFPLVGVIAQGAPARHVHDDIHVRCLVLDDGTTRIAFAVVDTRMVSREIAERAKALVHAANGFPTNCILISATHTHSTPPAVPITGDAREAGYHDFVGRRIADGICRAVNNLAPARIGWGAGRKPEFVFNRRWLLKPDARVPNPFGETSDRVQMNPPPGSPMVAGPAGPVDPQVYVLSVQHADGRPLALLANYGLHYIGGTGPATVSADYFGAFADRIQALLGADHQDPAFVGIMSNGTSGDVNGIDFSRPTAPAAPYVRIREVANGVADEVYRVYRGIHYHDWVPLAMAEVDLPLGVRHPSPARLAWAQKTWAAVADQKRLTNRRDIYARETIEVARYPLTLPIKLQAIRIGTLGIAATPCEMFAATGLQIKERSPWRETFTIELANGHGGYLPTPRDHELGGYETWLARSSYLEVDASEKIRDELLRLLAKVATEPK